MMKADYHVHCNYSDDSKTPMEEMICAAIDKGITELCFTDHVDYGVKIDWDDPGTTARLIDGKPARNVDYPRYFSEIDALNKKYENHINIRKGLEFGVQRNTIEQFNHLYRMYPLDFVILSCHQVDNQELWTYDYQKGKTQKQYNEGYYNELWSVIKNFDHFSVLGHLDLIVRYDRQGVYPFDNVKAKITDILKYLIEHNKGIEVNTSSFKYGLTDLMPSRDILRLYHGLGGRIITIGSDSHTTTTLADHFDEVKAELKQMGYTHYCIFEKMKPIFIEL